jgi:phage portal protein BeeE
MPLWPFKRSAAAALPAPQAAMQSADGGTMITTSDELDRFMRGEGSGSKAGPIVNAESSLQDPVVFACVRIICGAVATMPLDIKRRIDDRIRLGRDRHAHSIS